MIGITLSHYRIVEQIGAGGMGVVYRARDLRLERDVALKVLPDGALADDDARRRFRREALALSRLNHPAVESVFDFDTQDGVDFLVMELVPGGSLGQRLESGPLAQAEVIRLGVQIAEGLEAAHEQGVIHRDLKPDNIVVTPRGRVKLLDFGLAKLLATTEPSASATTITETGALMGTAPYMAPEVLLGGNADERTDLYSLGVALYEMVAGRRPFGAPLAGALIAEILNTPPPPLGTLNPALASDLARVVHRCLEKDPARRYASVRELLVDLRALESGVAIPTPAPAPASSSDPRRPRRAALVIPALALLVVIALTWIGKGRWFGAGDRIESLAVLPLVNMSSDPDQEFFADGMTEELIAEIAQVASLRVISRTSVMSFKGSDRSLPAIARALRVDAVVEGSVQRQGDRVRVTAQLIRAADDRHLWARTYERDLKDLLKLQSELASAITAEVRAVIQPAERARLARSREVNPAAHDAYLKGRYQWYRRTRVSLEQAIEQFQRAIAIDPTFAPAHSGLAATYLVLPQYSNISTREAYTRAREAVDRALALDDGLDEAHAAKAGLLHELDLRHEEAEKEYLRAIELNPNGATIRQWYGEFLDTMGRTEEAIAQHELAHRLDPLSLIVNTVFAGTLWHARRYDEAIARLRSVLEMDSTFARARHHLANTLRANGQIAEALVEYEKSDILNGRDPAETRRYYAQLQEALRTGGSEAYWKKSIELRVPLVRAGKSRPMGVATAYAQLGRRDEAFAWIDRAIEEDDPNALWIQADPVFDSLRSDPRYRRVLERLGFRPAGAKDG